MATSASRRKADDAAASFFEELKHAHRNLLEAMSNLDGLTRGPLPSKETIVTARWNLSRTSLARRTLWSRIRTHLEYGRLSEHEKGVLLELQQSDVALIRASTTHISEWRVDKIISDWAGYCRSSVDLRWNMLAGIGLEKRRLYPILQAQGHPR